MYPEVTAGAGSCSDGVLGLEGGAELGRGGSGNGLRRCLRSMDVVS